jgi:hypothetical protein
MFNKYRQPVDRAKLLTKLRELEDEWRAFEHRLREEEREIWQPNWSHGDALAERLSRVGYPQETIDALKTHLDIINRLLCGEPLSPAALRDLDQMDEADRAAGESAVKHCRDRDCYPKSRTPGETAAMAGLRSRSCPRFESAHFLRIYKICRLVG